MLVFLAIILCFSGLMSGLSGFGFSAIGALSLWIIPPKLGVPLLMSLSAANQLMSLGQLKSDLRPIREWWPTGPAPYMAGGIVGVPIGLYILHALPTVSLMLVFGTLLTGYALYSIFKPESLHVEVKDSVGISAVVGVIGGVIGGFTAFPGAPVVVWSGLRKLSKRDSRSIVQPYILAMQFVSIGMLAIQRPGTFSPTYWGLLAMTLPVVLPSTLLGVVIYRRISDVNFRKVTFGMLGASGVALLGKAASALALAGIALKLAVR